MTLYNITQRYTALAGKPNTILQQTTQTLYYYGTSRVGTLISPLKLVDYTAREIITFGKTRAEVKRDDLFHSKANRRRHHGSQNIISPLLQVQVRMSVHGVEHHTPYVTTATLLETRSGYHYFGRIKDSWNSLS